MRKSSRGIVSWSLVTLFAALPASAWAQAGFYVTPSVSVSEVYDDNIFNTSSERQDDFITRGGAGLKGGYQSRPFTLIAGYNVEGEGYADHTDLGGVPSSQRARLDSTYATERRLALSFHGQYSETQQSRDLNSVAPETTAATPTSPTLIAPVTTLETPRARSQLYDLGPSLRYELDPLTVGESAFTYSHSRQVGASTNDTYDANALVTRKLDPRNALEANYDYRHFQIDNATAGSSSPVDPNAPPNQRNTDSHSVTVGGRHDFSEATSFHVRAGPRFTEGAVDPEVFAELTHRLRRGRLELRYEETRTTAVGASDTLKSRGVIAFAGYDLTEFLNGQATLSYYRNSEDSGGDSDIYRAGVSLSYRLREWLSLKVSYDFSYEDGTLAAVAGSTASNHIRHSLVTVGIEASKAYRLD